MGEGGAILIQNRDDIEMAEIIREKGTDRSKFFRGEIDKYSWVEAGSSYLPSELNAAYLYAQLECADEINRKRCEAWDMYFSMLGDLEKRGDIELPYIPPYCRHNGHMFWIKTENLKTRTRLIDFLKKKGIGAVFHYVPLHSSKAGMKYGKFYGEDRYTTAESERLVRLPMFYGLTEAEVYGVVDVIRDFYLERV